MRYQLQNQNGCSDGLGAVVVSGGRVGSGSRVAYGGRSFGFRSYGQTFTRFGYPWWNQWYQPYYQPAYYYQQPVQVVQQGVTGPQCAAKGGQISQQCNASGCSYFCQTTVVGVDGVTRTVTEPLI